MKQETKEIKVKKQVDGLQRFLKIIEDQENIDWDVVRRYLLKIERLILVLEERNTKTPSINIPIEGKKAVLKALVILKDLKEKEILESNPTYIDYDVKGYWVGARDIKDVIVSFELFDLNEYNTNNVESLIGKILIEYGFIVVKRSASGNLRRIDSKKLDKLIL